MAKRATFIFRANKQKKRKGVHAKSKTSKNKGADNYKKPRNSGGN
jgi:hypothetical protein